MEILTRNDPVAIVIFGAGGDLAWRKLVPALYSLYKDGWLPERLAITGMDMKQMTDDEFRAHLRGGVEQFSRQKPDDGSWQQFARYVDPRFSSDFWRRVTSAPQARA